MEERRSIVSAEGCPYLFSAPQLITAQEGVEASRKSQVVELEEPW